MFISYNWLRELTGTRLNPEEVRDRLTGVGLPVDAIEPRGDDFVLDVEVPSNRGDCLSHIGIARELAVIEKSQIAKFNPNTADAHSSTSNPIVKGKSGAAASDAMATVEILDADLCPRYAARVVRGVKIAPSPEWLVNKLEVIGQRSIN